MNWFIENWYIILSGIAVITAIIIAICKFFNLPTKAQIESLKNWLLYAVVEAEKALGSKTGTLKLRMVYDMFLTKFAFLAKVISFERFSELVDEALDKMKNLLASNNTIAEYVTPIKED